MVLAAVGMAVIMEENESEEVRGQAEAADDEDELGMANLLRLDEALYGLEEDREAEGDEEDTVYKRAEGLGTLPLRRRVSPLASGSVVDMV